MLSDTRFFRLNHYQMQNYIRQTNAANFAPQQLIPIDSEQIAVVIQGPVFTNTHPLAPNGITYQVVQALRQYLPQAQLIFATWENQPIQNLDVDTLITLKDPGATNFYVEQAKVQNYYNNANRLIYSTQQGLKAVTKPYVLKIRSDLLLFHPLVSAFFGKFNAYEETWKVVTERILAFPIFTLKFEKGKNAVHQRVIQPRPFHVSDWAYFGLTEDLKALYNCELQPEPETSRWFETRPKPYNDIFPERLWRYSPEQYITANLAQRTLGIKLEYASQDDANIVDASERFIANNFVVLDQYHWGLWSLKLQHYQDKLYTFIKDGLYDFDLWQQDYKKFANG